VSVGIDPTSRVASWLIQAIDPETGEVFQDGTHGLLTPNDAEGHGAGYVSYYVQSSFEAQSGDLIQASARVLFDTRAPFDTPTITSTLDASAPVTTRRADPA
jgi:hypothetical protein